MKTNGTIGSRRSSSDTDDRFSKQTIIVFALSFLLVVILWTTGLASTQALRCRYCGYKGRVTLAFQVHCYSEAVGEGGFVFAVPYAVAMEQCE